MRVSNIEPTRRQTIWILAAAALVAGPDAVQAKRDDAKWTTLPATPTLPHGIQGEVVEINGTSLWYARFGHGSPKQPPVLFLHGGMSNSNYWGRQVEHLARSHAVIVMDTRGHGRSPVTSSKFGYSLFARDVAALMDFLKLRQASIVGWSDGAVTGLQLAMSRPERVARLFAFGGNTTPGGLKPDGAQSRTFIEYGNRCKKEYAELSPHPERWPLLLDGLRVMWRSEPNFARRLLGAIPVPTTISDGAHDEIIKRNHTETMARTIPGATLALLPDVSHFAMLQDPGQFNAALDEFLGS